MPRRRPNGGATSSMRRRRSAPERRVVRIGLSIGSRYRTLEHRARRQPRYAVRVGGRPTTPNLPNGRRARRSQTRDIELHAACDKAAALTFDDGRELVAAHGPTSLRQVPPGSAMIRRDPTPLRDGASTATPTAGRSARDADRLPVEGWVVQLPQHEIGDVGA
jgi:hypothetical protein